MEKILWILVFLILGYVLRKKISKCIKYLFIPQKRRIEGEYIKNWTEQTTIPVISTVGASEFNTQTQSSVTVDEHFMLLKTKNEDEITVKLPLLFSFVIENNLKNGKKFFSFLCKKYEWESESEVVKIIYIT